MPPLNRSLIFCTKRSWDIVKLYNFAFEKRSVGHILNKIIVIGFFQTRTIFLKWVSSYSWSHDQNVIFKIMNYFFLNTNFALKPQEKSWKDDVVTFTAYLSITILQCLTSYSSKHEVILSAMLANTNHTTLLKNQSALKYLPSCVSSQILGVR